MSSAIDPTKPTAVLALTADVRANFAAAKSEIEALQGFEGDGPYLPTDGGEMDRPIYFVSTGGTAMRSAQDRASDTENVLDYGAIPGTGFDSAPAINAACAAGRDVFLPAGTYRINGPINVGLGTTLRGASVKTTFLYIDQAFSPTASGVLSLNGYEFQSPVVRDLGLIFAQPPDTVTTASAATAANGTNNTVTVASLTGIAVNNYIAGPNAAIPAMTTITAIAGNVLTLSTPVVAPGVANGDALRFGPSRVNMKTLANGGTSGLGGTGVRYPPAIYGPDTQTNRFHLADLYIGGAWDGISALGNVAPHIRNIEMGALNIGWNADGALDSVHVHGWRSWLYSLSQTGQMGVFNVHHDGLTLGWQLGRIDGLNASNITLVDANFVATSNANNGGVPWVITSLQLDNTADLVIAGGTIHIASMYRGASSQPPASLNPIHITGGNTTLTNFHIFQNGAVPTIGMSAGNLTLVGGTLTMANGSTSIVNHSGGAFALMSSYLNMPSTLSVPAIVQTGGAIMVQGNTSHAGVSGVAVSVGADSGGNSVVGNDFPGYTITIPAAPVTGNYQLAAYNGPWGSQLALGAQGQGGRIDLRRGTDGGAAAWLGTDTASSAHIRLKNQSGSSNIIFDTAAGGIFSWQIGGVQYASGSNTYGQQFVLGMTGQAGRIDLCRGSDGAATAWVGFSNASGSSNTVDVTSTGGSSQVRLNAASGGADVFLIAGVEVGRMDINGHGMAKVTAGAVAPGAGFARLAMVAGTNAGTGKLVAYCGTSATPVTILDNIGAGF